MNKELTIDHKDPKAKEEYRKAHFLWKDGCVLQFVPLKVYRSSNKAKLAYLKKKGFSEHRSEEGNQLIHQFKKEGKILSTFTVTFKNFEPISKES